MRIFCKKKKNHCDRFKSFFFFFFPVCTIVFLCHEAWHTGKKKKENYRQRIIAISFSAFQEFVRTFSFFASGLLINSVISLLLLHSHRYDNLLDFCCKSVVMQAELKWWKWEMWVPFFIVMKCLSWSLIMSL